MIKLTLLASFAALADAFYGGYGYPYAHGYHTYVPFGSSSGLDPITQGLDPVTQGYVPYYGKRSADADAFYGYPYAAYAHPYAYGYPYAHAYVPFGSSTGQDPITQGLDPVTQGHVVKRSADADAFYAGYGYPYSYGHVSSSSSDPITQGLDPVTQSYGYYYGKRSADAFYGYPYAAYAHPYAYGYPMQLM